MNLRLVHALLIILSAALAVLFGLWCLDLYGREDGVARLLAAIESNCEFLLTGDKACFGKYFGCTLDGVTILRPAEFLRRRDRQNHSRTRAGLPGANGQLGS